MTAPADTSLAVQLAELLERVARLEAQLPGAQAENTGLRAAIGDDFVASLADGLTESFADYDARMSARDGLGAKVAAAVHPLTPDGYRPAAAHRHLTNPRETA